MLYSRRAQEKLMMVTATQKQERGESGDEIQGRLSRILEPLFNDLNLLDDFLCGVPCRVIHPEAR